MRAREDHKYQRIAPYILYDGDGAGKNCHCDIVTAQDSRSNNKFTCLIDSLRILSNRLST